MLPTQQALADARKELEAARDRLRSAAKAHFEFGSKALFAKHPEMQSFSWEQYTPYFCDGDQCVFSANISEPGINGRRVDAWDDDCKDPLLPAYQSVAEFLGALAFTDDDYEEMFGDHIKVTVTAHGVVTEECKHD